MQVKAIWIIKTLVFETEDHKHIVTVSNWPTKLDVTDMLHALCGKPEDGCYTWNEGINELKRIISLVCMRSDQINQEIRRIEPFTDGASMHLALSMATLFLSKTLEVPMKEARMLVSLNTTDVDKFTGAIHE